MSLPTPHRTEQVFANTPLCCPTCLRTQWVARPLPELACVHCPSCENRCVLVNHARDGLSLVEVSDYTNFVYPRLAECVSVDLVVFLTLVFLLCLGGFTCTALLVPTGPPFAWIFASTLSSFVFANMLHVSMTYLIYLVAAYETAHDRRRAFQLCAPRPVSPIPAWVEKC